MDQSMKVGRTWMRMVRSSGTTRIGSWMMRKAARHVNTTAGFSLWPSSTYAANVMDDTITGVNQYRMVPNDLVKLEFDNHTNSFSRSFIICAWNCSSHACQHNPT